MILCEICNNKFKNYNSIAAHIRHQHKITSKEYYDKYLKKDYEGKCPLCTEVTKYINISLGYKKYCRKCNNPKTLEQYIKIHGENKGKLFFDNHCLKIKENTKGINLGEKNGMYKYPKKIVKCSECNKEIEKHGISNNKNYFCDINCKAKWQSKNSTIKELNPFNIYKNKIKLTKLERYNNENYNNSQKNIDTKIKNRTLNKCYSHQSIIANLFFDTLVQKLPKSYTYYFKDKETFIWENKKIYFYDFECRETKKIIEFNGDYWHGNPKIYKEDNFIRSIQVKDVWEKDKIKINVAKNNGFDVLVIWEKDVKENFNFKLNECFDFIFNNEVRI
jgi:very-short-patch-repair endonuclease/endogenous inhibitor of DNA gyrase (YacG/DUF329 family)